MSWESLLGELQPLYNGGETLVGRLGGVSLIALSLALALHVAKLGARARAWHNIVRTAYPTEPLRFSETLGAFLAGVGVDSFVPARAGEVVRLGLLRRRLPGATVPGLASTVFAESVFDAVLTVLVVSGAIAIGFGPGFHGGSLIPGPLAHYPLIICLAAGSAGLAAVGLGFHFRARLRSILADTRRGFAVFANPGQYLRSVACWQALGWALRVGSVYCFLAAFHIPASLAVALLVVAVQLVAAALPLTPGGAGSQQAMLVVALSASAATTVLGFGIGMQAATALANLVLGAGALIVMTGSLHWRRLAPRRSRVLDAAARA